MISRDGGTTMATQAVVGIQGSEEKLIRAGQRGDPQAVETLFRRYQRPLFQTALRVLGNAEDAEDALQDGLLSAYRNLKRFEGRSQFSTWLTRIVINAALMRRRSAKARPAAAAAHGVRAARSAGLLDGRSRKEARRHRKHVEGAVVARASSACRAARAALAANAR